MDKVTLSILGCGALGSRIALELGSPLRQLDLYDHDRVAEENIGTSVYGRNHIGLLKIRALAQILSTRGCVGNAVLDKSIIGKGIRPANLVIDCFDNAEARNWVNDYCTLSGIAHQYPIVHVGVAQGIGEVFWGYKFYDPPKPNSVQICTRDLGRVVIGLTAAIAVVSIEHFLTSGRTSNFMVNEDGTTFRGS